jgi:hypothetical protein
MAESKVSAIAFGPRPLALLRRQACQSTTISAARFADAATAELMLDEGTRLRVDLTGSVAPDPQGEEAGLVALISIAMTDPRLAGMAPEEPLLRLRLLVAEGRWCRHWSDAALDDQARAQALQQASAAFDAPDGEDDPSLDPRLRRESLLHRAVKAILARALSLRVPELCCTLPPPPVRAAFGRRCGSTRRGACASTAPRFSAGWGARCPTSSSSSQAPRPPTRTARSNTFDEDRLARIRRVDLPTLEIDLSRTGHM